MSKSQKPSPTSPAPLPSLSPEHQAVLAENGILDRIKGGRGGEIDLGKILALIKALLGGFGAGGAPADALAAPAPEAIAAMNAEQQAAVAEFGINLSGLPWGRILALVESLVAYLRTQYPAVPSE